MKKEIVFCTDSLNIGGIELALIRILKKLVDLNEYKIKLCIKNDEKLQLLSEIPKEIEIIILSKNKKFLKISWYEKYKKEKLFLDFIKNSEIVIDYYDGNWFKLFDKIKNKKKIVFFHTILKKLHIYKNINVVKKIYDNYVILSEGAKKELINIGIEKNKIKKIYNIIPIKDILYKSSLENLEEEKEDYFLMLGRLVNDSKDYNTVIESFENTLIKEKLYIVGDGPYKDEIEKKIKIMKLENKIKLLGNKKNPYPILKKSKGLIVSSRFEGLPNVMLEGLVLEKYIIASDCPYGPKEILGENSKVGTLYPMGNKRLLIESIMNIDKKQVLKEDYEKQLEKFSEEKILKEIKILLEE